MKIVVQKEIFVVLPVGPVKSLDNMITTVSREEADNIKEAEEDMSDDKFAVIPATISVSLETRGGTPYVAENKVEKKPQKKPIANFFQEQHAVPLKQIKKNFGKIEMENLLVEEEFLPEEIRNF